MNSREEILEKIHDVPALPTAIAEIIRMVQDPDVSFDQVTKAIEYDPSMTSNVLRIANSVYMQGHGQIHSVKNAVVRLGLDAVFSMVMASCTAPIVGKEVKGYNLNEGTLWKHSIAVALCSRILATEFKMTPPKHAFTSGLLHDVGKIVIGKFLEIDGESIRKLAFDNGISFEEAECEILGVDHAEVGAELLDSWNLPEEIIEVVRWHHNPDGFTGEKTVIDLIHLADSLCINAGLGVGSDELNYSVSKESVDRLGFTVGIAENVISETLDALESALEFLGVPEKR